jgi:hypothetical protein
LAIPAGFISGVISDGSQASLQATVDCPGPQGSVNGIILTAVEGVPVTVTFSSSFLHSVIVRRLSNLKFISALFLNAQVVLGSNTYTNGSVLVSGTLQSSSKWSGTLAVVVPSGPTLHVAGVFTGSLQANRSVICQVAL